MAYAKNVGRDLPWGTGYSTYAPIYNMPVNDEDHRQLLVFNGEDATVIDPIQQLLYDPTKTFWDYEEPILDPEEVGEYK